MWGAKFESTRRVLLGDECSHAQLHDAIVLHLFKPRDLSQSAVRQSLLQPTGQHSHPTHWWVIKAPATVQDCPTALLVSGVARRMGNPVAPDPVSGLTPLHGNPVACVASGTAGAMPVQPLPALPPGGLWTSRRQRQQRGSNHTRPRCGHLAMPSQGQPPMLGGRKPTVAGPPDCRSAFPDQTHPSAFGALAQDIGTCPRSANCRR